ncbi:MAG: TIGR03118 family protein [Parafilimonas sp.]|nr:TIGR03118 family protein [Parafilimonas sp.]
MKIVLRHIYMPWLLGLISFTIMNTGCQKTTDNAAAHKQNDVSNSNAKLSASALGGFTQLTLTANTQGYHAVRLAPNQHNAWGMSASDEGGIWVSAADGGVSYVYNNRGVQLIPPVSIPSHIAGAPGNPTGNIYNGTSDFMVNGTGLPAEFLFASEDGTVSAWNDNTGSNAVIVADRSKKGASYKGLAIASDGGTNYLYVTNFPKHKIDVFDKNFNMVTGKTFKDPGIPSGYSPFNIRNINNMLYVTYALTTADGEDDSTGAGLGYVDVYNPDGSLSKRFATQGVLNAPWGITEAQPQLLGMSAILIGNFGDGHISVFDWDGNLQGQLKSFGKPVAIDGLWAIDNTMTKTSPSDLYFTAGPNHESDGIFGFLSKQ